MSQQRPDLFKNLPSLDDLPSWEQIRQLPQVQALSERVAQSGVANQMQSVLQQLMRDDAESSQRSARSGVNALFELAARVLGAATSQSVSPVINATGMLVDSNWSSVPVPQNVQQVVLDAAKHYTLRHDVSVQEATPPENRSGRTDIVSRYAPLAKLAGSESALAVHSYELALFLICDSLAHGKELLIARGRLGRTPGGESPDTIAQQARARWREVGTADFASADDFASGIGDETGAIWAEQSPLFQITGNTAGVDCEGLASLARHHRLPCIASLNQGPLWSQPLQQSPDSEAERQTDRRAESVADAIAQGADLVLLSSAGLFGGPPAGLIFGTQSLIAQIAEHPLAGSSRLDPWREAAIQQTGRNHRQTEETQLPPADSVSALWLASTENLQLRAERIAAQLQGVAYLSQVNAGPQNAYLAPSGREFYACPTYVVELHPEGESASELSERLRRATPPILGRQTDQTVTLDLRSVSPSQDAQIVDALRSA